MSFAHLPIVAFDPSTHMGYALWHPERKKVVYGTWHLGKHGVHGQYFHDFLACIEKFIEEYGLSNDLRLVVAVEAPVPSGGKIGNQYSHALAEKWVGALDLWCYRRRLAQPIPIQLASWRYYFHKNKKPKELKGVDGSRWFKEETMRTCNLMGLNPKDHNAGDAIGILKFVKDGGTVGVEKRREQEKREKANIRAQRDLDLEVA